LQKAVVLTVVETAPANDGQFTFRPGYFGKRQQFAFKTLSDVDLARGPKFPVATLGSGAPTLASVYNSVKNVWLDQQSGWTGRFTHPVENLPDYGAELAIRLAKVGLRVLYDDVKSDDCALVAYLQVALDIRSCIDAGLVSSMRRDFCV
jgi:hypothetical protein